MNEQENKNISEMRSHVEKFIQRYYDLEVVMSPEAHKLSVKSGNVFSDNFADAITTYQYDKDNLKELGTCIGMINKAYSHGLLQQGSDLLIRLDECRKKNADLLKDLAICMANYSTLKREHERLVLMLDQNQSAPSEQPSENNE